MKFLIYDAINQTLDVDWIRTPYFMAYNANLRDIVTNSLYGIRAPTGDYEVRALEDLVINTICSYFGRQHIRAWLRPLIKADRQDGANIKISPHMYEARSGYGLGYGCWTTTGTCPNFSLSNKK